jgi:serine/threonine protein kinase
MACCFKPALRRLLLKCGFKRLADLVVPDMEGNVSQLLVQVQELQLFMVKQKLPRLVDTTPELRPEEVHLDTRVPLGRGGYGVVLRGTLVAGKKSEVAVKALFASDGLAGLGPGAAVVPPDVQKQMRREATIMCSLNHPNVLRILGVVPERGWIVMELCACGSLKSLLMDPEEPLDLGTQLRFATETATGVAYLHMSDVAIVHGDLKADNVLLTRERSCRLSDFGMSDAKDRSKNLTRAGVAGQSGVTVPWTAPEVLAGEDKTYASDVYALGLTLWEIFERGTPYGRVPEGVIIHQVLSGTRPPMTAKTPAGVAGLVAASWAPEVARRPSAAEVACFLARKESEHQHSH